MRKEKLNLQDKEKLRVKIKNLTGILLSISALIFIVWIGCKYYLEESWIEDIGYLLAPASIFFTIWIINFLDSLVGYKLVIEGTIQNKQRRISSKNDYYMFEIKAEEKSKCEEVPIPKEQYDKFEISDKVNIEQTAITKTLLFIKEL